MKRASHVFEVIVSEENLKRAILDVVASHRWRKHHILNRCSQWLERTIDKRTTELKEIIINGFVPTPPKVTRRYDTNAKKWRTIYEPPEWPDQCVHHALVQAIEPVCMRGMDAYCCGSIKGRGMHYGAAAIKRWMRRDPKGTRYCFQCDIRQFYPSLKPEFVLERFKRLVKDYRALDLIRRICEHGIFPGYYTSQWLANTFLQPLDVLIRAHDGCAHYARYMDNMTVFSPNKRKLRRLKPKVDRWLGEHGLSLKGDWQFFSTRDRLPDAMGYRYGHGYTLPRKRNYLKLKRGVARYRKKRDGGRRVSRHMAQGLLSRYGNIKHCSNVRIYRNLNKGERIQRELKAVVRRENLSQFQ